MRIMDRVRPQRLLEVPKHVALLLCGLFEVQKVVPMLENLIIS